jgi:hypothetical protein
MAPGESIAQRHCERAGPRWLCTHHKPFTVCAVRALLEAADALGAWPEEEESAMP